MEPNDLKPNSPPDDAQLEAWLRTNSTLPPLPDDGFTSRVIATLPAPQRSRGSPRLLAIIIGAVAGLAFAAFKFFTAGPVDFSLPPPSPEAAEAFARLADPKLHAALGATVLTLAFVFWHDLRRRVGL